MSKRGVRLLKALESYTKKKPNQFDTSVILSKVKLRSISHGASVSKFTVERSMCNGGDTLHGGYLAACVDTLATFAHLGTTGKLAWTMNLHVDFVSAARIGDEITVETSVMRSGAFPVIEAKFTNAQGGLVAKGVTSMLNGAEKFQSLVTEIYDFEPGDDD